MKNIYWIGFVLILISVVAAYYIQSRTEDESYANISEKSKSGIAVVELFTSEGCSSCPAAEELVGELQKKYSEKNLPVYFLAYHVDYWNYLGWVDEFSSKEFTQRQQLYVNAFGLQSAYTPQMIVNGLSEFVGSNRTSAIKAIESALSTNSTLQIDIKGCLIQSDSSVKVIYACDPLSDVVLHFALVERDLIRGVTRGENSGKRLLHPSVVRAMKSVDDAEQSEVVIPTPRDIVLGNAAVIVLAQKKYGQEIIGASSLNLIAKP